MIKDINRKALFTFFYKLLLFTGTFFLHILLARYLSEDAYGEYSSLISYGSVIGLICLFGLNIENMRLLSSYKKLSYIVFLKIQRYFLSILMLFFLIISLIVFVFYNYINNEHILLVLLFGLCFGTQLYISDLYRGLKKVEKGVFFGGTLSNIIVIISLLFYRILNYQFDLFVVLYITLIGFILNNLYAIIYLIIKRKKIFINDLTLEFRLGLQSLKRASAYWLQNLLVYSIPHMIIIFISFSHSDSDVALYTVAIRFVLISSFGIILLNTIVAPYISEMIAANKMIELEKMIRQYTGYTFYLSCIGIFCLYFFGPYLLENLFGVFYKDSYLIFMIIASGQLINLFIGTGNLVLQMSKKTRALLLANIISYLPLLVLTYCYNEYMTLIHFAILHALMVILSSLVSAYYVKKIFKISINADLLTLLSRRRYL